MVSAHAQETNGVICPIVTRPLGLDYDGGVVEDAMGRLTPPSSGLQGLARATFVGTREARV